MIIYCACRDAMLFYDEGICRRCSLPKEPPEFKIELRGEFPLEFTCTRPNTCGRCGADYCCGCLRSSSYCDGCRNHPRNKLSDKQ